MTEAADVRHMGHALALARRALGSAWPNPAVGCIIERDGRILGRGWTQPGGRPHAEAVALAQAGALARGATAHVTLEPCAHTGRTLPCAEALVDAGIARVSVAAGDPDPRVNGQGLAILRRAGVTVATGALQAEAQRLNRGFFLRVTRGRPLVTLKLATSFDGRIATAAGESRWITGSSARRLVHAMRLAHDAVVIGGGTAGADDPLLTVRDIGPVRQPVRIVLSRGLNLDEHGRLAASAAGPPLWLLHGPDADPDRRIRWRERGARLLAAPLDRRGRLDLAAALGLLAAEGLTRIFCEGGGTLAASLLAQGLVDDLALFTAGVALGAGGRPALGEMDFRTLADAPRLILAETRAVGGDVLQIWTRAETLSP